MLPIQIVEISELSTHACIPILRQINFEKFQNFDFREFVHQFVRLKLSKIQIQSLNNG